MPVPAVVGGACVGGASAVAVRVAGTAESANTLTSSLTADVGLTLACPVGNGVVVTTGAPVVVVVAVVPLLPVVQRGTEGDCPTTSAADAGV